MPSYEVVVIGGGCVGAGVAYHLAEAGRTDVQRAQLVYELSPDHNAMIGAAPEVTGLCCATGFSGSPAGRREPIVV